mmetsp:Transcript_841/g.2190  ORF Transcript_841/g.2190 Transcript_841/m.2190 type:complete len:96 (-) Transcript_841:325-612(-)
MGLGQWAFATMEAVMHAPRRGRDGAIQVLFVFLVASPLGFAAFFFFNMALQVTSFTKLLRGTVGGWEVTQRGPPRTKLLAVDAVAKDIEMHGDVV